MKSWKVSFLTALLSFSLLVFFEKPCHSDTLYGGVQHSEAVAPVPSGLMPGNAVVNQKLTPNNNWIQIPDWMAGTWQFKSETVTSLTSLLGQKFPKPPFKIHNEFTKKFGYQKDKNGGIWDYLKVPFSYTTTVDDGLKAYFVDNELEVLETTSNSTIRRLFGMDSIYNPVDQVITITQQKECLNKLTPMGDNLIRIDSSTKIFDMNGKPEVLKQSNVIGSLLKPYEQVDEEGGQNLKEMFVEYLQSHGKADLVPM
jgi:hypothetical protein